MTARDTAFGSDPIVRLAWSRRLGLADDGLTGPGRTLVERADTVSFLRLFDHAVLVAPAAVLTAAQGCDTAELADPGTLLRLAAPLVGRGARVLGRAELGYTDEYVTGATPSSVFRADADALTEVIGGCPPDDVIESGLGALDERFVQVDDRDRVVAAAGFEVWDGILAHFGVLCRRDHRTHGHGSTVARVAVNQALDDGLVPQWRARADNRASRRLADRLGFVPGGSQTTVLIGD